MELLTYTAVVQRHGLTNACTPGAARGKSNCSVNVVASDDISPLRRIDSLKVHVTRVSRKDLQARRINKSGKTPTKLSA